GTLAPALDLDFDLDPALDLDPTLDFVDTDLRSSPHLHHLLDPTVAAQAECVVPRPPPVPLPLRARPQPFRSGFGRSARPRSGSRSRSGRGPRHPRQAPFEQPGAGGRA